MHSNQAEGSKGNILVVDDTLANVQLLSKMLTDQGYKVRKVLNGQMALMGIQTAPPDLVLLDINMPEMSGYQVCRQLKADEKTREIPIIFISALDEAIDKVRAFAIGGADYITKPFQLAEVLARVEHQLTLRNLQRQLKEQNALLQQEIQERERALQALEEATSALQEANQELKRLVTVDDLTQLANRRYFYEYLEKTWRQMARDGSPLSLLMCDVDYFKPYNDTYGHQAGDECLRQVAQTLRCVVNRPTDLVARYGGEEFAAILPNTPAEGAVYIARKMQSSLQELCIAHAQSPISDFVTVSIGVASTTPELDLSPERLIAYADRALYAAKDKGRNCILLEHLGDKAHKS